MSGGATEERRSPLVAQVVLLVAFLALAVAGVFTVLVPELSDASDEAAEADDPAGDDAEADDEPAPRD